MQPDAFIPERWSSQSHLILQKGAFNPFLSGKYSCAGRPLALMEMRMLVSLLIHTFDFHLAKHEFNQDGSGRNIFEQKDGYRDYFVAKAPSTHLVFTKRTGTPLETNGR